ncbi:MAG: efflux RND transporter periplasmic adaptor subunit [Planctomycetaceae bacterium]|jgi:membrane fusion protein (multidrug efflux system)|nr:efflux RND transporter periplasmic adaptor subunit [Planctomycetaceae bacterium]
MKFTNNSTRKFFDQNRRSLHQNHFNIHETEQLTAKSQSGCSRVKSAAHTGYGIVLVCLAFSILICVVSGCGFFKRGQNEKDDKSAIDGASEVIVEDVLQNDVQLYLYASAETAPYKSVDIRVRVPGYLREYFYSHGEVVKQDSRLALIEPDQYQFALEISKQDLVIAQQKEIQAEKDYKRDIPLAEKDIKTQEEILQRETEYKTAIANARRSKVAVDQAELNLKYTDIRAPITGKTTQHLVDENNYVSPGTNEAKLLSITQLDPLYIDFTISDTDFADLKDRLGYREKFEEITKRSQDNPDNKTSLDEEEEKGNTATNKFLGFDGSPFEVSLTSSSAAIPRDFPLRGKIKGIIDNRIVSGGGQITIRGEISNPLINIGEKQDYLIYAGQICRVRIPFETVSNAVLISEEALLTDLDTKYVFIVQKGKYIPPPKKLANGKEEKQDPIETDIAYRRDVKIGRLLDNQQRIILHGVKPGEKYIIKGVQRARHGSPVKPLPIAEFNERREKEAGIGTTNENNTPKADEQKNEQKKISTGTVDVQPPVNKD